MKFLLLLLVLIPTFSAHAEVTILMKGENMFGVTPEENPKAKDAELEYYFNGPNLRIDIKVKDEKTFPAVLWRGTEKRIVVLNPGAKEYFEMTEAQMKQLNLNTQQLLKMNKQFAAQMPPEARKQLEKALKGNQPPPAPTYKAAGTKQVRSWTCNRYIGTTAGKTVSEICTVPIEKVGVKKSDLVALDTLKAFTKNVTPFGQQTSAFNQWGSDLGLGFPVEAVTYTPVPEGKDRKVTVQVVDIVRGDRGTGHTSIPADFKKAASPASFGAGFGGAPPASK